uniref:Uncharacterized protein n=1 Tax=Timema tahoe TaxID=61484 RepID=A0A7R9FL42_9NEOP|nr:unnamed protein product [Timema tahoe]
MAARIPRISLTRILSVVPLLMHALAQGPKPQYLNPNLPNVVKDNSSVLWPTVEANLSKAGTSTPVPFHNAPRPTTHKGYHLHIQGRRAGGGWVGGVTPLKVG